MHVPNLAILLNAAFRKQNKPPGAKSLKRRNLSVLISMIRMMNSFIQLARQADNRKPSSRSLTFPSKLYPLHRIISKLVKQLDLQYNPARASSHEVGINSLSYFSVPSRQTCRTVRTITAEMLPKRTCFLSRKQTASALILSFKTCKAL